ncbi:MAG: adenylate kinase [Ktedonobacteraceae bacterium]
MDIILIGAPGAGKGTQATMLSQALTVRHISSGDLFRKAFDDRTPLGLQTQKYIDLGELVPDALTVSMVLRCIEEPESTHGVLLDGYPRTLPQIQALDVELQTIGREIDLAIYLPVPQEELLKRLDGRLFCQAHQHVYHTKLKPPKVSGVCDLDGSQLYQRADDKGEPLRRRLVIFFTETIQLLDYYKGQNKLREIDGNQSIEQVQKAILREINGYIGKTTHI